MIVSCTSNQSIPNTKCIDGIEHWELKDKGEKFYLARYNPLGDLVTCVDQEEKTI